MGLSMDHFLRINDVPIDRPTPKSEPKPTTSTPVDGSDRKFYAKAAEKSGDKTILQDFDAALKSQGQAAPRHTTPTSPGPAPKPHVQPQRADDPSDQKFYNMAADRENKIIDLENRSASLQRDIDALGTAGGYATQAMRAEQNEVETELAALRPPAAVDVVDDAPEQSLTDRQRSIDSIVTASPYAAQAMQDELNADVQALERRAEHLRGSINALGAHGSHAADDLQAELDKIEAELAAYRGASETMTFAEFKEATGEVFNQHVDELIAEEGHDRAIAERIVSLQFGASGVPSEALPENVAQFDPIKVFQDQADAFDTAKEVVEGDRANPDQFTSLDDLDAIINNPERFDPDVVTTAILLRRAADQPGNEEFREQFEKKSFWEQVKDSPWLDPNSDSLVVNLVRGAAVPGVGFSPAFSQRVVDEGPGVLRQIGSGAYELSTINQVHLALTDPGQLAENYRSFGSGLVDWGVDTAKLGVGLAALTTPGGPELLQAATGVDVRQEAYDAVTGAGSTLLNDPDELAQAVVGWDQFVDDPWRWAGNQAPDIILEILGTKGASKLVKGVDVAGDVAEAGRVTGRLDDIPGYGDELARLDDGVLSPDVDDLDDIGVPGAVIPESTITGRVGDNEISWRVDGEGRPVEVSADIHEVFEGATRSNDELAAQRNLPGKIEGDHAGHVIGHRFGLDQGMKNLFPQNGNFNTSAYKKLENEMADFVNAGAEVRVDVQIDWGPNGRPETVAVQYDAVDPSTGRTVFSRDVEFDNVPGQSFDRVSSEDIVASLNGDGD